MIDSCAFLCNDAGLVVQKWVGVNAAGDRTTVEDLLHHGVSPADGAVLGNGGVREAAEASAVSALFVEAAAGASCVEGRARGVHMRAEAFLGVAGACKVRLGGLVADAGASLRGDVVNPLVRAINGTSVAGANSTAIQQVLHRQVDVYAHSFASNLDTVAQCGDCTVSPAGTAVLRDVLVPGHSAVALAILVAPGELRRHLPGLEKLVGAGLGGVSTPGDSHGLGVRT
mmetsp:Transcript_88232/g.156426  ORF Transcript_88232/g.156426 Transcript_88232/m.156426 type:complete len:228 (-) Transcript_88232:298-981(-)